VAAPTVGRAAADLYERLGPFAKLDTDPDWVLLRFCDVLTSGSFEQIYGYVRTGEDGTPGWAAIFDPDLCPPEALPYLAQFVGVAITPDMSVAEQRQAILLPAQWQRGTLAAMLQSIVRELTGSKTVLLDERYSGDAYKLRVRTFASETPDPARTLAAILLQKPAGITLLYEAITGQDWDDLEADHADWNAVMADYATWTDVVADLP
jgi:tail protein P2 I